MAIFEIPTRSDIFRYEFQVELEDVTYRFKIVLNRRTNRWVMDIENAAYDIPLVGGNDLFKQFHHIEGVPPGEMKVLDLDGLGRDAEELTLSDRIVLAYKESA